MKYVAPCIAKSFNCPHCGTFSHQTWFRIGIAAFNKEGLPKVNYSKFELDFAASIKDMPERIRNVSFMTRVNDGEVIKGTEKLYGDRNNIENIHLSMCYTCGKYAVWHSDRIIYPDYDYAIHPNEDLPDNIKSDFTEAAHILKYSPRGSAALLRLCVQKLCKHLGEKGENINNDIAALVEKGLDRRIQRALDTVRVIGNQSVHPGEMDLRDDRETAMRLFELVNMIADHLITQEKKVDEMFGKLPESARAGIEKRDGKKAAE